MLEMTYQVKSVFDESMLKMTHIFVVIYF